MLAMSDVDMEEVWGMVEKTINGNRGPDAIKQPGLCCGHCAKPIQVVTKGSSISDARVPQPDDLCVCGWCARYNIYAAAPGGLRLIGIDSEAALAALPPFEQRRISAYRDMLRARIMGKRGKAAQA